MFAKEEARRRKQCDELVEELVSLFELDIVDSLQLAYISENEIGRQVMSRRDMRNALNYILPRPRQLEDGEYQELVHRLDPNQTNYIDIHDYLQLFKPKPKKIETKHELSHKKGCQCFEEYWNRPKGIARPLLRNLGSDTPLGKVCPVGQVQGKADILGRTATLISVVNQTTIEDGLEAFGKSIVFSLRCFDEAMQEEAKLAIQNILLKYQTEAENSPFYYK